MRRTLRRGAPLLLVGALLLSGCSGDDAAGGASDADAGPGHVEVTLGEEFTFDDFTVPAGWEYDTLVEPVAMQDQEHPLVRARVVNEGDEERSALFEFVFGREGRVLATIRCSSTAPLQPGATGDLLCPGLGQPVPKDYDQIVVQQITR